MARSDWSATYARRYGVDDGNGFYIDLARQGQKSVDHTLWLQKTWLTGKSEPDLELYLETPSPKGPSVWRGFVNPYELIRYFLGQHSGVFSDDALAQIAHRCLEELTDRIAAREQAKAEQGEAA